MPPLHSGLMEACPDHTRPFLPHWLSIFRSVYSRHFASEIICFPHSLQEAQGPCLVSCCYSSGSTLVLSHSWLGQSPATRLTPSILIRTPLPCPRNYTDFTCPIRVFSCASVILTPLASWAPPTPSQEPKYPSNCLSFPTLSQSGYSQHWPICQKLSPPLGGKWKPRSLLPRGKPIKRCSKVLNVLPFFLNNAFKRTPLNSQYFKVKWMIPIGKCSKGFLTFQSSHLGTSPGWKKRWKSRRKGRNEWVVFVSRGQ